MPHSTAVATLAHLSATPWPLDESDVGGLLGTITAAAPELAAADLATVWAALDALHLPPQAPLLPALLSATRAALPDMEVAAASVVADAALRLDVAVDAPLRGRLAAAAARDVPEASVTAVQRMWCDAPGREPAPQRAAAPRPEAAHTPDAALREAAYFECLLDRTTAVLPLLSGAAVAAVLASLATRRLAPPPPQCAALLAAAAERAAGMPAEAAARALHALASLQLRGAGAAAAALRAAVAARPEQLTTNTRCQVLWALAVSCDGAAEAEAGEGGSFEFSPRKGPLGNQAAAGEGSGLPSTEAVNTEARKLARVLLQQLPSRGLRMHDGALALVRCCFESRLLPSQ